MTVPLAPLSLVIVIYTEKCTIPRRGIEVAAHPRRRLDPIEASSDDGGVRLDPSVPTKEIPVSNPEIEGQEPGLYEVIGEKVTCRVAQRPGSNVVLRHVRKVYRRKAGASSLTRQPRRPFWRRAART
jgi:hypothetical protein